MLQVFFHQLAPSIMAGTNDDFPTEVEGESTEFTALITKEFSVFLIIELCSFFSVFSGESVFCLP